MIQGDISDEEVDDPQSKVVAWLRWRLRWKKELVKAFSLVKWRREKKGNEMEKEGYFFVEVKKEKEKEM